MTPALRHIFPGPRGWVVLLALAIFAAGMMLSTGAHQIVEVRL